MLVLGIRIPRPSDPDALAGVQLLLVQQWPSYVVFALTFMVVGTVWANHRLMFSHFLRTDHVLVSLNLLELMSVAFLPVPTGVLGTWATSAPNRLTAVLLYGGTLAILGVFHNLLWWYGAYWRGLTSRDLTASERRALTVRWMAGPVLYGASVGLAWLDPRLSLAGFAILGILYLLPSPAFLRWRSAGETVGEAGCARDEPRLSIGTGQQENGRTTKIPPDYSPQPITD